MGAEGCIGLVAAVHDGQLSDGQVQCLSNAAPMLRHLAHFGNTQQ